MTLQHFLESTYAPLTGICQRTQSLYAFTFLAWGEFLGREPCLSDLTEISVARFLAHRVRSRAAATAAKDRAQIRAVWEFAKRRNVEGVTEWPQIRQISVPERVPEAWTVDEFAIILRSAAQERVSYAGIPAADWWRACLLLALDTAERITALLSLRWDDVRGRDVIFRAESRKGGTRDIAREISRDTSIALEAIREPRRDLVLPWPRSHSYVWRRYEIILRRAGLPCDRRSKFHRIRRTTASYYAAAGLDAQTLLDHRDAATTRKYISPIICRPVAPHTVIHLPGAIDTATATAPADGEKKLA